MATAGSYEAKTRLPELLKRIEKGEHITITRHGKSIAVLLPAPPNKKGGIRSTIDELRDFRSRHTLDGLRIDEMIEEGRKS
jgi:prevent-host-death family protein